jgi:hypothetical protein
MFGKLLNFLQNQQPVFPAARRLLTPASASGALGIGESTQGKIVPESPLQSR